MMGWLVEYLIESLRDSIAKEQVEEEMRKR